ncbi:MAG: hypothetical protein M1821_007976 [Bathelium mastoideum]|nr:MAG: hypothetical protein M1821_007976 [Bathelium mastoideum]
MRTFVKGRMGSSNEGLARKSNIYAESTPKVKEQPIRHGNDAKGRANESAPRAAPVSKVKREPDENIGVEQQHSHGPFDTDIESIGDSTTNASMFFGEQQKQDHKLNQTAQQPQPFEDEYRGDEVDEQRNDWLPHIRVLRQQYPLDFENDEQALDALMSGRVLLVGDRFMWNTAPDSYPTTTSGQWEEDDAMKSVDSYEDQEQIQIPSSEIDEETQRFDVFPQRPEPQSQPSRSLKRTQRDPSRDLSRPERDSHVVNPPHDVYRQLHQQAGAPPQLVHRESRPITPQPPAKAADRLTPGPTPFKETAQLQQLSLHLHDRYNQLDTQADGHDQLELDFEPSDLFSQDFKELKRMPFDEDPHAADSVLGELDQTKSLSEQLVQVRALAPNEQAAFFTHLSLDDWEDAGDWFVAQFSQILQFLKDGRREKRKLAIAFENEIERRHEAVSRRRDMVDDALKGMRTSGAAVLQGTPSKSTKAQ